MQKGIIPDRSTKEQLSSVPAIEQLPQQLPRPSHGLPARHETAWRRLPPVHQGGASAVASWACWRSRGYLWSTLQASRVCPCHASTCMHAIAAENIDREHARYSHVYILNLQLCTCMPMHQIMHELRGRQQGISPPLANVVQHPSSFEALSADKGTHWGLMACNTTDKRNRLLISSFKQMRMTV